MLRQRTPLQPPSRGTSPLIPALRPPPPPLQNLTVDAFIQQIKATADGYAEAQAARDEEGVQRALRQLDEAQGFWAVPASYVLRVDFQRPVRGRLLGGGVMKGVVSRRQGAPQPSKPNQRFPPSKLKPLRRAYSFFLSCLRGMGASLTPGLPPCNCEPQDGPATAACSPSPTRVHRAAIWQDGEPAADVHANVTRRDGSAGSEQVRRRQGG
mgnify:CR=1 FL=1